MVCITSSFLTAAVVFSTLVSAAPAKRQDTQTLSTIDPSAIPSDDPNGSAGGSVQFSTSTESIDLSSAYTTSTDSSSYSTSTDTSSSTYSTDTSYSQANSGYNSGYSSGYSSVSTVNSGSTPSSYGSGSVTWQGGYNDCVQQCFDVSSVPSTTVDIPSYDSSSSSSSSSNYGSGSYNSSYNSTSSDASSSGSGESSSDSTGNGVVHNVMVEPVPGAEHFVPAFLTVNVGDTVVFTVVNGQHSIVQSSATSPCNATANGFNSGVLSAGATFTQVISSTDPTFMFSDVSGDCLAGLFGALNAATGNEDSNTTVAVLMPQWAASNADINAQLVATNSIANQTGGLGWASKIDVSSIPAAQYPALATSILYTRRVIGQNPEMVGADGVFRPTGNVVVPADLSQLFVQADLGGYSATDTSSGPTSAAENAAASTSATPEGNGVAIGATSSRFAVAGFAILVAFFAF